ncbi:MutS protein msh4 [Allomyces arbusculus]|nr:MutS protein msh4 [Allomyces arbusculus]
MDHAMPPRHGAKGLDGLRDPSPSRARTPRGFVHDHGGREQQQQQHARMDPRAPPRTPSPWAPSPIPPSVVTAPFTPSPPPPSSRGSGVQTTLDAWRRPSAPSPLAPTRSAASSSTSAPAASRSRNGSATRPRTAVSATMRAALLRAASPYADPRRPATSVGTMAPPRPTTRANGRSTARTVPGSTTQSGTNSGATRPATSGTALGPGAPRYVVALSPHRTAGDGKGRDGGKGGGGGHEMGLCAVDLASGRCMVTHFADTRALPRTLHRLTVFPPAQLIVPSSLYTPTKSEFALLLEESIDPDVEIVPIDKQHFSATKGQVTLRHMGLADDVQALELTLAAQGAALAAISAAFTFLDVTHAMALAHNSIRFVYTPIQGTMMIDALTAASLELVVNQSGHASHTLFGVLNQTKTTMGAQLLRCTVLQPSVDQLAIETRLDAVQEIIETDGLAASLVRALKDLPNVDKLISGFIYVEKTRTVKSAELNLVHLVHLRQLIAALQPLRTALAPARNVLLVEAHRVASDAVFETMDTAMAQVLEPDLAVQTTPIGIRNQRAFAVRTGMHGLLDVARQTYRETTRDIYQLVNDYASQYQLPLKIMYSPSAGFDMELRGHDNAPLPPVFVNVVKKRHGVRLTTLDIMKLNDRIRESMDEIFLISDQIVQDLTDTLRQHVGVLYRLSESVALVDMLAAFAACARMFNYVRPQFLDAIAIQNGRHPVKDLLSRGMDPGRPHPSTSARSAPADSASTVTPSTPYVPNDTYLDGGCNVQLVMGANMAGKTTYLKQVATLVVMAHLGSYVPADVAHVAVVDQILSRMALGDCLTAGTSSFMVEMTEVAYLLRCLGIDDEDEEEELAERAHPTVLGRSGARGQALVLIDELGRGTSPSDALGITYAVVEALAHSNAYVLFATHFHALARHLRHYPNVASLHLDMHVVGGNRVRYLYKVHDGASADRDYGLRLAATLPFPPSLLQKADAIATWLKSTKEDEEEGGGEKEEATRAVHEVARRLGTVLREPVEMAAPLVAYLEDMQRQARATIEGLGGWDAVAARGKCGSEGPESS